MVKRVFISDNEEVKKNIPESKESWNYLFHEMKRDLRPVKQRNMPFPYLPPYSDYNKDVEQCFLYCHFINDILDCIRAGNIDYCFYIYQIEDLLKYEPRLKSCWLEQEQCFRVWI